MAALKTARKIRLAAALGLGFTAAAGFVAGAAVSIDRHGDWLPMRQQNGHCEAFDTDAGKAEGDWLPDPDGKCHIGAYIWHQLFSINW